MKHLNVTCVLLLVLWMLASCSFAPVENSETSAAPETVDSRTESDGETGTEAAETESLPTEPTETAPAALPSVPPPPDGKDVFVPVSDYIPDMIIDLKYAGQDNFTGQVIYDSGEAWLRYGTVEKLMLVQAELKALGYGLKLWDGFRPPSAQFKLWEICPDPAYVSDPNNGFSNHSRGNTVDITLVDGSGNEIEMPTGFDDFTPRADRDYSDCTDAAAANARMLEDIMEKYGFKGYRGEWWHYTDTDSYDVEHVFVP